MTKDRLNTSEETLSTKLFIKINSFSKNNRTKALHPSLHHEKKKLLQGMKKIVKILSKPTHIANLNTSKRNYL